MRRARRIDANQPDIVKLLRQLGCVVAVTSDVGRGFPDLVVRTAKGTVLLVEVKDGQLSPSRRNLTDEEEAFSAPWCDSYVVVMTDEDAIRLAGR